MILRNSLILRVRALRPSNSYNSHQFSSIGSPQISPNLSTLNHKDWLSPNELVKIFQTLKNPNLTLTLFNQISVRKDYKPNEALYTVIINKLALAKDFDGIENVMKRVKIEKSCKLSEDFFYNVIRVYGLLAGRINLAINTLFDMPDYGCWPTVKTFNFVLNLLVNTKQYDVIHKVYMGGFKLGIEVDACCLNILIKGLCGCGDLDAAFKVLNEFPKQRCRPNVRTYSTLIHKLCDKGRVDEAFELFKKMEREDIEPDTVMFNILISGLRKRGKVGEAIDLMHKMRLKGCEPNAGTYLEIMYGLIDAEKFVEAKNLMSQMILKGKEPSFDSFKKLISGLCKHHQVDDVDWVLRQMVRHHFVPKMGMWRQIVCCVLPRDSSYAYTCVLFEGICNE